MKQLHETVGEWVTTPELKTRVEAKPIVEECANEEETRPTLLVIEDNEDIADYIRVLLKDRYQVSIAYNGHDGLEIAGECVPDLILTDLMMPGMDGYTLCREVRASEVLNHIPIIIVTAKSEVADRIHSLEEGADAFLLKPFSADELLALVERLLEQRRQLRDKYSKAMQEGTEQMVKLNSADREFLDRLTTIINNHLSNKELNVDFIANNIYMSRSQLNRKIRTITGYSTLSYILQIRMGKAKRLLASTEQPIGDVATACGFEDTSYFTRFFRQICGITPTQFRKQSV